MRLIPFFIDIKLSCEKHAKSQKKIKIALKNSRKISLLIPDTKTKMINFHNLFLVPSQSKLKCGIPGEIAIKIKNLFGLLFCSFLNVMIMIQFYLLFIVIREIPFQLNGKRYLEKDNIKRIGIQKRIFIYVKGYREERFFTVV